MIVLTGGAGFIGSCLLKALNDSGQKDITVVDHLGLGPKWKNLGQKRFSNYLHKDDFRHDLARGRFGDSIDTIIHLGACTVTTERDSDYIMDNNLAYSVELAEYARKHNCRFIYASSAATYGNGSKGYSDTNSEGLMPLNPYGLSKQLFDLWVYDRGFESIFTGFKFFNVFGPNEYHKGDMASMVYKSFKQIDRTGKVKLFRSNDETYHDGGQMRDFVYVKDVVDVLMQSIDNKSITGIFNLGTGLARNWNDLVTAVFGAMDKPVDIEYVDMPESLIGQYQNYTQADMQKLGASGCQLNFRPLEDSVTDYVKNYLMSEDPFI